MRDSSFSSETTIYRIRNVLGLLNIRSLYWQTLQKLYSLILFLPMHFSQTLCTTHKLWTCRKEPQDGVWQLVQTDIFFGRYPCWHGLVWQSDWLQLISTHDMLLRLVATESSCLLCIQSQRKSIFFTASSSLFFFFRFPLRAWLLLPLPSFSCNTRDHQT